MRQHWREIKSTLLWLIPCISSPETLVNVQVSLQTCDHILGRGSEWRTIVGAEVHRMIIQPLNECIHWERNRGVRDERIILRCYVESCFRQIDPSIYANTCFPLNTREFLNLGTEAFPCCSGMGGIDARRIEGVVQNEIESIGWWSKKWRSTNQTAAIVLWRRWRLGCRRT